MTNRIGVLALERKYRDLADPKAPAIIRNAVALYKVKEFEGLSNNPEIMKWAREAKVGSYTADSIPWCGLFALIVCHRSNWTEQCPESPLWALNWLKFGQPISRPGLGDVLVWSRKGGGHVGFYVGEDSTHYYVLGGNQSDEVNIQRLTKSRDSRGRVFRGARQPIWRISRPDTAVPIMRTSSGVADAGSLQ